MSRRLLSGLSLLTVSALAACDPSPCGTDAATVIDGSRVDAGGADASLMDGGRDAGSASVDASAPDAGLSTCAEITPASLAFRPVWLAAGPGETRRCEGYVRFRLFAHGETTPLADTGDAFAPCEWSFGRVPPGDYDVVVEHLDDPRWIVGAALVRPDSCPTDVLPTPPHCAPIRLRHSSCDDRALVVVLHCDPSGGSCPDPAW